MSYKVAGIDVHKKVVMVVVIDRHNPDAKPERRRFLTMPGELQQLSLWLRDRGVAEVVMESTAQYWRSVWMELEPCTCCLLLIGCSGSVRRFPLCRDRFPPRR